MRRTRAVLVAIALVAACGGEKTGATPDGGAPDARSRDGSAADASMRDDASGPSDGAVRDDGSAPPDDAAPLDAAPSEDARAPDGGGADGAATRDAGPVDDPPGTWRSALFPRDWRPVHEGGSPDAEGRFLPDFSYAGWHRGEARPPYGAGDPVATVSAALGDGETDATAGIQSAIDDACAAGGGVVALPAGTFVVRLPSADAYAAIRIECSGLVLRGAGPAATRILFDDAERARGKIVIAVRGGGSVIDGSSTETFALARDVPLPTRSIELEATPPIAPGDWVAVRNPNTDAFRAAHRMDEATSGEAGLWPTTSFRGLVYPRRVVRVTGTAVELDGPIHDPLHTRDGARLYALPRFVSEVGLESFSVGMVESRTTPGATEPGSDDDYESSGTTGYEVHASRAIELERVHDAWVYDVDTFGPSGNTTGAHVLSSGLLVEEGASRVTVENCDLGPPQYRGGGGNGYLVHVQGHDTLFVDCTTEGARHGFIINNAASGNVFLRATTRDDRYSDDAHRFLANSNLYDGVLLDRAWLQAVNRGTTSSGGGFTATRHVFWATHVMANHPSADGCAVESAQWEHGYLIGSSAEPGEESRLCPTSFSNSYWASLDQGDPRDFVEGEGMAATLWPTSLFGAQLANRCAREGLVCESW